MAPAQTAAPSLPESHGTSQTAALRFPTGEGPGSVAVVDLNGDGKLDVVTANAAGGNATVLLGDGKAGFTPAPGSPFSAGHSPNDLAVGDFDRDGRLDLAFANHDRQNLTVLLGDGRGTFRPAPRSPVVVAVKPHPHGLAAGDFNGDGNLDLVTDSWGEDRLEILFGDGKGSFATPGTYVAVGKHPYQRVRVADLNGDGRDDIVCTNLEGNDVTVLLGDGKGGFHQPAGSPFPGGDSPFNVAIGDINADGHLDLAVVDSPSSTSDRSGRDGLTILLGDGRGAFAATAGSPLLTAKQPNMVAIGETASEVVVSSPDGDQIVVFSISRAGTVASRRVLSVPGHPKGLAIRDLDGDGKADIVVTNSAGGGVTVLLGR